ncbi:MAG: hypothetical protein ABI586_00380 [Candidatus Nanopelagicales bacterium]
MTLRQDVCSGRSPHSRMPVAARTTGHVRSAYLFRGFSRRQKHRLPGVLTCRTLTVVSLTLRTSGEDAVTPERKPPKNESPRDDHPRTEESTSSEAAMASESKDADSSLIDESAYSRNEE